MKKVLSIILAFALAFALLTGCGKSGTDTGTGKEATSDVDMEPADDKDEGEDGEVSPTEGEPVKFSYYRWDLNVSAIQGWQNAEWVKELEKRLNIDIEFQGPQSGDDYTQAATVMLAAGDYPHIIFYNWNNYNGGLAAAIEDGVVVNVSEKYKDKMPNWFSILENNEDIRRAVTLDDGTSALFCHIELDLKRGAYAGNFIRGDWLENVGMEVPTTVDELYEVLVAFRDQDPNKNGQPDEIPWVEDKGFAAIGVLAGSWGLIYQDIQRDPNDPNKITYWPLVNDGANFTDFITTLNKWYKEKLLDQEFASQDDSQREAKILSHQGGFGFAYTVHYNTWSSTLKETVPEAKMVGLKPLVGIAGKPYGTNHAHVRPTAPNEGNCITVQAEKDGVIDACLKFIDYLYSEEGSTLINWGIEGVSYTVEPDGTKKWTDAITNDPEFRLQDKVFVYAIPTWGSWPKIMDYDAWASIELTTDEAKQAHENYWQADTGILVPPLLLSQQEGERYSQIMTDVNTALSENFVKFVMGTRPLSEISRLLQEIKDMGIEEAMEIYQRAYDRYMAK